MVSEPYNNEGTFFFVLFFRFVNNGQLLNLQKMIMSMSIVENGYEQVSCNFVTVTALQIFPHKKTVFSFLWQYKLLGAPVVLLFL